jgi:hypothetical protein
MQIGRREARPLSREVLLRRLTHLHSSMIDGGKVTRRVASPIIASGVRPMLLRYRDEQKLLLKFVMGSKVADGER